MGERILVCGGRDYRDREKVAEVLGAYWHTAECFMTGCAPGADTLAWDWGWDRGFLVTRFMADWKKHGRAAGPIRNQQMLDEGKPTLVIAFPGGRGTADMIRRAKAAGVPVVQVPERATAARAGEGNEDG